MDFDRALPGLVGPSTPMYTRNAGLVQVESYQHDPKQPATPVSPQHLTMLTRELRNLVVGLGGTPNEEDDAQLSTLLAPALHKVQCPLNIHAGYGEWTRSNNEVVTSLPDQAWAIPITLPVGWRIQAMTVRGRDTASNEMSVALRRMLDDSPATTVLGPFGGGVLDLWSGTPTSYRFVSGDHTVAADYSYFVELTTPSNWDGGTAVVSWVAIDYDATGE